MMMDFKDNMMKCEEYIRALEDERVKIQVFQRELPLCLELVTQAIEAYKQQLSSNNDENANNGEEEECVNGNSECSEQETSTGNHGPILEEFIPLKSCNSSQDHPRVQELQSNKEDIIMDQNDNNYDYEINEDNDDNKSVGKKSDWLRSVQLWNQPSDPTTIQEEDEPKRSPMMDLKKNGGGAFQPFQKEKGTTTSNNSNSNVNNNNNNNNNKPTLATAASSSSSGEAVTPCTDGSSGGGGKKEDKGGQRKSRRCWSPELHKRFVHALHQLGGSHVATPKQIRELMEVDGLTNDEVKSHLQKYRLHTARRPGSTNQTTTNPSAPQFVVVGGIWMPPPEYTAMATPTPMNTTPISTSNGVVYAPIATMATPIPCSQQQHSSPLHCEEKRCQSDGGVHSNSTSTSSTHTTKTSHVY